MFLSVFDLFKIGIGPSSSHTVGPMVAARRFTDRLRDNEVLLQTQKVTVRLHGSLAFTGRGHATDRAVILGLLDERPDSIDPASVDGLVENVVEQQRIRLAGNHVIDFEAGTDIVFDYGDPLEEHTNGLVFEARDSAGHLLFTETYFSIGGGFVATREELNFIAEETSPSRAVPFPFKHARDMLEMGQASGKTIAEMKFANEVSLSDEVTVRDGLSRIWHVMRDCMDRGFSTEGDLPGGLKVRRRAPEIARSLNADKTRNVKYDHAVMDWISLYAMAVNEENAAGGKVVTAPTNGAAGVIPATIRYYLDFCPGGCEEAVEEFLLTAAAIGGIIKSNASISGAEVGCQGEVGSAAAMAAAGLCAVLGGTNEQIENAAEIAIEHHLGMTCDPVGGLVQVPCIERNAMGAVKAVNAASLALRGDGTHFVPLDDAIETMRQTGLDMLSKYKETSQGGLAVNITEC